MRRHRRDWPAIIGVGFLLCFALGVGVWLASGSLGIFGSPPRYTPPAYTPPAAVTPSIAKSPLRMVVLGDSIAGGSDMGGNGPHGWPAIVASDLGATLFLRAQGGTGYTTTSQPNTSPYPARVDEIISLNPDLVIVEGSRNDTDAAATRQAAISTLGRLHSRLPKAKIFVIGPIYSFATNQGTTPVNDAVKAAANAAGLTYIDAVAAGWFTGPDHDLIGSDGVHPTDAGHRYLAGLIEPIVAV